VDHLVISSSWLIVKGDVVPLNGRRPNGKKYVTRKKRGKPISEACRREQQRLIDAARERRRSGLDISYRS
jgi:hypothetical protein